MTRGGGRPPCLPRLAPACLVLTGLHRGGGAHLPAPCPQCPKGVWAPGKCSVQGQLVGEQGWLRDVPESEVWSSACVGLLAPCRGSPPSDGAAPELASSPPPPAEQRDAARGSSILHRTGRAVKTIRPKQESMRRGPEMWVPSLALWFCCCGPGKGPISLCHCLPLCELAVG